MAEAHTEATYTLFSGAVAVLPTATCWRRATVALSCRMIVGCSHAVVERKESGASGGVMFKVALLSSLMRKCVSVKSRRAETFPFASRCVEWAWQEWDSGSPTSVDFFPYVAWAMEIEALELLPVASILKVITVKFPPGLKESSWPRCLKHTRVRSRNSRVIEGGLVFLKTAAWCRLCTVLLDVSRFCRF